MDWKEFNELKKEAWQTKTTEEYEEWKNKFKVWYREQETTDEQNTQIYDQLEKLNKQKTEWLEKQKNHPTIVKNSFIFQDDLAKALTEYIKVKTKLLAKEIEKS